MSANGLNVEKITTSKKHQVKHAGKQAVYFLLSGVAEVTLNGEKCELTPLSSIYVPKGAKYMIRPAGEGTLEYMIVHTE